MVVVAPAQSLAAGAPKVLLLSGQPTAAAGALAGRVLLVMVPGQQGASPERVRGALPQRLTHLSPEEKTARDREKARMSELEQQAVDLEEENQKLLENQLLQEKTHGLVRLGTDALVAEEEAETKGDGAGLVAGSAESTALRLRAPLQQVQAQLSPLQNISPWTPMVLTLQTLSLISCWAFCSTWTQSYSSDVLPQSLPKWTQKWTQKDPVPYWPPLLHTWGRHQPSWKPLMT
uniref:Uncharacterized protein n=1 Tax=Capra hircus TaxID=9925 RepID=A0A452EWY3_CAPHI